MTLICASLTIGGAIATTTITPAIGQPSNRPSQVRQSPAPAVIQSIRQAIKGQFGISTITLVNATEQNWPDGCLGLPRGKEGCTAAIVPGWRVAVSDGLQSWIYRTDRSGKTLRLENPNRTVLPRAIASKVIQQAAKDSKTPAANLRIADVKSQEYNGCLGIYRPNQACTMIAMNGWQAIVTSPTQTLIYHLTANQIVQNETASGATQRVQVSFEPFSDIAPIGNSEVFRSSTSGDPTGRTSSLVLTQDGKITRYQSSPTGKFAPVVIKTLSASQLTAFKQVLETQRLPNLNGLNYLTDAVPADFATTTYQSPYSATQFIERQTNNLPRSLQQVITKWNQLTALGKAIAQDDINSQTRQLQQCLGTESAQDVM